MSVQEESMPMRNPDLEQHFSMLSIHKVWLMKKNWQTCPENDDEPGFISITFPRCPSLFCSSVLTCTGPIV